MILQIKKIIVSGNFFKIIFTTLKINITFEIFQKIFEKFSFFIVSFIGLFMVACLLFFLTFFIYSILYYSISKIDWIKKKKRKEFSLIEKQKFLIYIIKYLIIIILVGFVSFLIKYLINLLPIEVINFNYYIFNSWNMSLYWLSSILLFYSFIYFSIFIEIKNYLLLFGYRFLVFFILRVILYILCPEEYTIYINQGLLSIFLFPDLISSTLAKVLNSFKNLICVSPFINVAEAEGGHLKEYLDEKYPEGDPKRDKKNYPRIKDWDGVPMLPRQTFFAIEETFYLPPLNPNVEEEYTLGIARRAHKTPRIYMIPLRELNFMCSEGEEPWVSMPIFTKIYGIPTYPVAEGNVVIRYEDDSIQVFSYKGQKNVINYIVSDSIYTIKASGSGERENYSPLHLWHMNKKMYVNDINGQGFLIGNSRGRIYENKYLIQKFQQEFLKERYNVRRITD